MSSTSDEQVLRPRPRQAFSLTSTPDASHVSRPSTPSTNDVRSSPSLAPTAADEPSSPPSRTRSILNLTSSTLFGIYSHSDYAPDRDDTTPWGTGAQTPLEGRSRGGSRVESAGLGIDAATWHERSRRRRSTVLEESTKRERQRALGYGKSRRKGLKSYWVPLAGKTMVLGVVGVCYGLLISQIHERQQIAPVRVDGIPHSSKWYLTFWGVVAVIFGQTMPWVDRLWEADGSDDEAVLDERQGDRTRSGEQRDKRLTWSPEWNDVVRSIGAFVGIAFAIRKLPWQSTLQVSLTLALSNPAIWYLLDRTPPGFIFSTTVALSGTALCLAVNPDIIPPPSSRPTIRIPLGSTVNTTGTLPSELVLGLLSHESVGVATWIASVLFFSAVCFGNIGRRL